MFPMKNGAQRSVLDERAARLSRFCQLSVVFIVENGIKRLHSLSLSRLSMRWHAP
jgi:hypothetical protein